MILSFWRQVWNGKSLVRAWMNTELARLGVFQGEILDIGGIGEPRPSYRAYLSIAPTSSVRTANIDPTAKPDILADAARLPCVDQSFDHGWCFNLLEHVPDPFSVLKEAARVMKSGGSLTVFTPFFIRIHGHPQDFARYTDAGLRRMAEMAGWTVTRVQAVGTGPWAAAVSQIQPSLPRPIFFLIARLAVGFDRIYRLFRGDQAAWPLGYFLLCSKP